jgi:hypothetical protein
MRNIQAAHCVVRRAEGLLEERMRKTTIFAGAVGLTIGCFGASGASALTSISPAGVRMATEAMDSSTLVHCRPYRHWHPWGYGTGCHGGGVSVEVERGHRRGVEIEGGHRGGVEIERGHRGVEERSSIHSRTTTRGETSVRGSTSTKSETKSGTSTTSKSGTSTGGGTGREQGGEKSSSGGSSGGMSGSSGGTSGGQKQ